MEQTKPDHTKEELKEIFGDVWDTTEVQKAFKIGSFLSPWCFATRRADGMRGSLTFQHNPRFYFNFKETDR